MIKLDESGQSEVEACNELKTQCVSSELSEKQNKPGYVPAKNPSGNNDVTKNTSKQCQ